MIYMSMTIPTFMIDHMYWESELKPPQEVLPMENVWPEKELGLANHQLIFCAT